MGELKELVFYPASWLYNALVYGFLKVLKENDPDLPVEEFLKDDGRVVIDKDATKKLYEYKGELPNLYYYWEKSAKKAFPGKDIPKSLVASNKTFFPNLGKGEFQNYMNYLFSYPIISTGNSVCLLCGENFDYNDEDPLSRKFLTFPREIFGDFSSSIGGFPNKFWNSNMDQVRICRKCAQLGMFRFIPFKGNSYFINAPSFKVIWFLNELLNTLLNQNDANSNNARNLLAIALLESPIKLATLLGGWARQNLEIISYTGGNIQTFSLPSDVVDALLDSEIHYINKQFQKSTSSREVERELLDILSKLDTKASLYNSYKYLKGFYVNNRRIVNPHLSYLYSRLTLAMKRIQKGGNVMKVSASDLRRLGSEMSKYFKNTKYRLLELVRLGKVSEAYHLILRTYISTGKEFPKELNEVFEKAQEDEEAFKANLFAYISGMTQKETKSESEETQESEVSSNE